MRTQQTWAAVAPVLSGALAACAPTGPATDAPCDYPDYAALVGRAVGRGECRRGIVIDGVGVGSAMAANKIAGRRSLRRRSN